MKTTIKIQQAMHYCGLANTEYNNELFVTCLHYAAADYPWFGPDGVWDASMEAWRNARGDVRDAVHEYLEKQHRAKYHRYKMVTLEQAMEYCGLATNGVNDQSMKVFLHSLRIAAPHFKGFGDLIEGDDTQGVSEEAWDAIKDAVKERAKIFTQGAQ